MQTMIKTAQARRALLLMGALAALWAVLAVARDGVTYHLAPLIVAAIPAPTAGYEGPLQPSWSAGLALIGAGSALGVTFLLAATGRMDGPSLLPFGGAAAEAVIFAVIGALAGWLFASGLKTRR